MRKSLMLSTAVVMTTLVFSSAAVLAQRPGGPGRGGPGPRLGAPAATAPGGRLGGRGFGRRPTLRLMAIGRHLDLTDDQRAQVRTIVRGMRTEAAPVMKAFSAVAGELRAARRSEAPDAAKIADLQAQASALRMQLADISAKARPNVLGVLTPEQTARLDERRVGRR